MNALQSRADLLVREGIVHSVAHPLYGVHDRLCVEHFEQLIRLFHRFELSENGIDLDKLVVMPAAAPELVGVG